MSLRTRSRGNSFPRDACRDRAVLPPPPSIVATLSRKSATSAVIAARFCANIGSRVDSFVGKNTVVLFFERRETRGEQHEQPANRSGEPTRPPRTVTQSASGAAREPRDRQIDEQAIDVEQGTEQHERKRLCWRVGGDELREERKEKERHLG